MSDQKVTLHDAVIYPATSELVDMVTLSMMIDTYTEANTAPPKVILITEKQMVNFPPDDTMRCSINGKDIECYAYRGIPVLNSKRISLPTE